MSVFITFAAALLIFGAVIAIHEFGHFAVAKLCGVQVNEFSIGMGPTLIKTYRKGTQYTLRLLPVGGFVALEGEESPESEQAEGGSGDDDGPEVITCPTCGRTQYPCTEIANEVERRLQGCKKSIKVAVMGCVVNGPGEAREADIGIAGGKGEAVLFVHGEPVRKLTGDNILGQFMEEIYKL